jgi:hypothetical protein
MNINRVGAEALTTTGAEHHPEPPSPTGPERDARRRAVARALDDVFAVLWAVFPL